MTPGKFMMKGRMTIGIPRNTYFMICMFGDDILAASVPRLEEGYLG